MGAKAAIKSADIDAIEVSFADTLQKETATSSSDEWETWQIVLLVAACVIVVGAAIAVPVVLHLQKKAKLQKAFEDTRVKKNRLDTTDDKSIDVYADDEEVEETQKTEETVEETPVEAEKTEETAQDVENPESQETAEETAKEDVQDQAE